MDHTSKLSVLLLMCISMILFTSINANANKTQIVASSEQMILNDIEYYNVYLRRIQEVSGLEYDFYRYTCPEAEAIISSTMKELFSSSSSAAPQLLRLVFHDCIVGGCDASVLLDKTDDGNQSEKEALPNLTLKGFDHIELIKSRLEEACPGAVSCADTLVLAAREGVFLAGGPYYPLFTGRRDSLQSYFNLTDEIPTPFDNITAILGKFRSKGFTDKEVVSLLGSHDIGSMSCQFFSDRMFNFHGTKQPDPSINSEFLSKMMSVCGAGSSPSASLPSGNRLDDNHYHKNLLNGSVALFSDQQLMADPGTAELVRDYASDEGFAFRRDFARGMVKLSSLDLLTGSNGDIRNICSKL